MPTIVEALKKKYPDATGNTIADIINNSGSGSAGSDAVSLFLEPVGETRHITYVCDGNGFSDGGKDFGLFAAFDDEFKQDNYNNFPYSIRLVSDVKIYVNGELTAAGYPLSFVPLYPDGDERTNNLCFLLDSDGNINPLTNGAWGIKTNEGFNLFAFPEEGFDEGTIIDIPSVPLYKIKNSLAVLDQLIMILHG